MRLHIPIEISGFELTGDPWEAELISLDVLVAASIKSLACLFNCSTGFLVRRVNLL